MTEKDRPYLKGRFDGEKLYKEFEHLPKLPDAIVLQWCDQWKEVYDKGGEIDPKNELDWMTLTLGWALGKGIDINTAHELAIFIRYQTHLG